MKTNRVILLAIILFIIPSAANSQDVRHPFLGGVYFDYNHEEKSFGPARPDSVHIYEMRSGIDSGLVRKSHYSYDKFGKLTWADEMWRYFRTDLQEYSSWDTTAFLSCEYNPAGNLTGSLVMVPDEDYVMKTVYCYSEDNLRDREVYTRSFDNVDWDSIATLFIEYDDENRILSEWERGDNGRSHNYNVKNEYTYNEAGKLAQLIETTWSDISEPVIEGKTIYTYDEMLRVTHVKYYGIWGNPSLFLSHEVDYSYGEGTDFIITERSYNYDGSMWYYTRDTYRHNDEGKLTGKVCEVNKDDVWTYQSCDSFVYNNDGFLISEIYFSGHFNTLVGQRKSDYLLDEAGNPLRQLQYRGDDGWILEHTYTYFYSSQPQSIIRTPVTNSCYLYPNPTGGSLFVASDSSAPLLLTLYSMQGKILHRQVLTGGTNTINYEFPCAGNYLVKISDGKNDQIQKIVVK